MKNIIKGIFWQPQLRDLAIGSAQWKTLMETLMKRGINTLVVQWTQYDSAFSKDEQRAALLAKIMLSQQVGLKLVLGLNADAQFFSRQQQSGAMLDEYLAHLNRQDERQLRQLQQYALTVDGWYISAEIDDANWQQDAARHQLLRWLGDARYRLSRYTEKPIYISSFFGGNMPPSDYGDLIEQIRSTGLMVWIQDGSGTQSISTLDRQRYLKNSIHCFSPLSANGVIRELFITHQSTTFHAEPKSAGEIDKIIAMPGCCCKDRLFFSLRYLPEAQHIMAHD